MTDVDSHKLLTALQLGVISREDVIAWADRRIGESDDPPYWLIEVSTATRASKIDLESLLRAHTNEPEPNDQEFLGVMSVRLLDLTHALKDILPMMYERFCLSSRKDTRDEVAMIYLIDDEFDWDPDRGVATAKEFLRPYLESGRSLVEQTKS